VAASVARRYWATRSTWVAVPAELRSPLMALTFPSTARTVPLIRQLFRLSLPSGPGVTVTTRHVDDAPSVRVRVTVPAACGTHRPGVLWIHGGGTVIGSPQFESSVTGHLARELGCVVVAPAYRLAPENPFPASLDDCMATLWWMREHADELGIDADRIASVVPAQAAASPRPSRSAAMTRESRCALR
jgi:acetyl esterase/lipase